MVEFENNGLFPYDLIIKEGNFDENLFGEYIREGAKWLDDYVVEKLIGKCIYQDIKELVCSDVLDVEPKYKELAYYILQLIVYGLKAELPRNITYQHRNQGLVKSADPNGTFEVANPSEITAIEANYKNKMEFYAEKIIHFLNFDPFWYGKYCNCECPCWKSKRSKFGMSMTETSYRYRWMNDVWLDYERRYNYGF